MPTLDDILSLTSQYGYLIVFLGVLLESTGVPIPGETILIAAGVLVQQGYLNLGEAIVCGILGTVIGAQVGYWAGREGGRRIALRWGRHAKVTPERLMRMERLFERHGGKAVFLSRFIAGLRIFGALIAGVSQMRRRTFLFYNTLGGAVWATGVVLAGYLLGGSLDLIERWAGRASLLPILVLVLMLGLYFSYRWVATSRVQLLTYRKAFPSDIPRGRLGPRYARQLRWLLRSLTPGEYLGLYLTFGLLVAVGGLWLFGELAENLGSGDPLVRFDETTAVMLHAQATPAFTAVFFLITSLGTLEVLGTLGLLVAGIYSLRRRWLYVGTWIVALAGGEALDRLLKEIFARPRPFFADPLLLETTYSFPSGHAMMSLVAYGMLTYFAVLVLRSSQARVAVVFGIAVLVLLIGFSRIYLGVHYFSDVIAGFAVGGVWLSALITGMEIIRRRGASKLP
ncbi:MAG: bifunctional DedA family/phosphatase PAP2 family protein [Rubrobacter sp.]|nr:bifunctional DedA family/phosphatase PAP2 family protein [Rubrobacter sp.]